MTPITVFRADASVWIGTGHVMRCLTLAAGLREKGHECHFICREHHGDLIETIRTHGFFVHALPLVNDGVGENADEATPAYANWLGASWEIDARESVEIVDRLNPDWLVIDHYALDARWQIQVKPERGRLLVIDDLADRPHKADVLLDQNLGRQAEDYMELVPASCRLLIGPQYALLGPEFPDLRGESLRRRRPPRLKRHLVTMGGVDQNNATGKALNGLRRCPLPDDAEIEVVMGRNAPWLTVVREQAAAMPWPTRVEVDIPDMARRMVEADLAIGAAGSTSWERCCLGLPALIVALAENQLQIAQALSSAGAAVYLADFQHLENLERCWKKYSDPITLRRLSDASASITDGKGTERLWQCMAQEAEWPHA